MVEESYVLEGGGEVVEVQEGHVVLRLFLGDPVVVEGVAVAVKDQEAP